MSIRKRLFRAGVTALLITLAAMALGPLHSIAAQRPVDMRFGLVNAYEGGAQAAAESGAGWEVVTLRWDKLQPASAAQWKAATTLEDGLAAARAASRDVAVVLYGTPAWATDGQPGTGVPRGLYLPAGDSGNLWAAFVRQATAYFAARGVNHLTVWRNPDIPPGGRGSEWDGSVQDYYQLVRLAYLAARAANPNAQIHLGGVGEHDPGWFARFLDIVLDDATAPANNYYFDIATIHAYDSPDKLFTLVQNHFYLMEQKGLPPKEVWINETNARPAVDPQVYPADKAFRQHPAITLEQQAAYVVQAYALGFAANRGARIAVYRLVDNLAQDGGEAFGLLRADGSERPAYRAYQLVVQEFSGFVYARRVEDETHPLIDYVRLTFEDKVTHVAWARTERSATLVIPARSQQAALIDLAGNRWIVTPQDGVYRVAVGGADCNDPVEGCLIGGAPWLLVEQDVPGALEATPPPVEVEEGGVPLTPDPAMLMTMTAQALPSPTPTLPTATPLPSPTPPPTETATALPTTAPPPEATVVPEDTPEPAEIAEATAAPQAEVTLQPQVDLSALQPHGFNALLPYLLVGAGILVIGAGVWYFVSGRRPGATGPDASDE
jgi:hypothetical protein